MRVIENVTTSVAAFVGPAPNGLLDTAVSIRGVADFEREFGVGTDDDELRNSVAQFFGNGGAEAWVVRVTASGGIELASSIQGDPTEKTGIYALDAVDNFNLLCIPATAQLDDASSRKVITEAMAYCRTRRAFSILDPPKNRSTPAELADWMKSGIPPDENTALYFPSLSRRDAGNNDRLAFLAPSGAVAGVYARTATSEGVWRSPAGIDAVLMRTEGLAYHVTDEENDLLMTIGVNSLRSFSTSGSVVWGARTLAAASANAEFTYVPIRRLSLFIEESIDRGTKWVVFEPNGAPLWEEVRLSVEEFLHRLFVKGALAGKTPREAYFVKCGRETMTQDDVDQGVLILVIGFAALRPAEFVVFEIEQRYDGSNG